MFSWTRWLIVPAALAGLTLVEPVAVSLAEKAPAPSRALTVQDDAGFFSQGAVAKANQEIARIKAQYHKDLAIETIAQAPARPKNVSDDPKSDSFKKFFTDWAAQRFTNDRVDGVAVYILKKPHVLRVVAGNETQNRGLFTEANRDALKEKIAEKLSANKNDEALAVAVAYVSETMSRNYRPATTSNANKPAAAPAPAQQSTPWGTYILIGLAVVIGLWLLMAVIRGLSGAAGGGGGYAGAPGGGGGGGFMTGFLGGLVGAAAGMWMYNTFFGGHSSSAWASPPNTGPMDGNEPGDTGAGGVSGGDYGDGGGKQEPDWGGGGGGDGGGDAGGGDWGGGGGGDWGGGGGGDFGGGGGGDW